MTEDEDKGARGRRWTAAAIASAVAFVMGQAFAYTPIKVFSDEEILSVVLAPDQPLGSVTRP